MYDIIRDAFSKLTLYCENEDFKGYDPFDGLNSSIFNSLPLLKRSRLFKLLWIQFFKLFPINLRPLVGIKKDYNPKALGLFLSGYCNLYKLDTKHDYLDKINWFIEKIINTANTDFNNACWGYNFDWQSKAFFLPKNTPTIVVTTFIGNALLDAYEITGNEQLLKISRSACDFIINDLNKSYDDSGNFAFSYSPLDNTVVFNASMLGSRFLARVYSITFENELLNEARKSVVFCCNQQRSDGSWSYGTLPFHQWIDNFHTGFMIECLADYIKYTFEEDFKNNLDKGFEFYINTFFTSKGESKYYHDNLYPVDIHSPAQLIITLSKLNRLNEYKSLVERVILWTINNMHSNNGYFYYKVNRFYTSRISYIRWAQAWMFYAFSEYLLHAKKSENLMEE